MRLTSHKKRSAIVVVLFHNFAVDAAIFLASYIIDERGDFLGRQQHVAFFGGIDHSDRRRYRPLPFGKRNDRPELEKALAACKKHRAKLVMAKLDWLSRNLAFIAMLMDRRVDFVCCDNPTATRAARVAALINPSDAIRAEAVRNDLQAAVRTMGVQLHILNASSSRDIDAAFDALARERADALFAGPDAFFNTRRVQLANLAAHHSIPTAFVVREYVEAGGLMSYGTSVADMYRQVGAYTGNILKGAKLADLPVLQSTKLELVINAQTARMLRLTVPSSLLSLADEAIE
jgi:hypothetical protein